MSNEQELQHHGVIGMKWGVRRYQNKDGSLTPAGKSHKKIKAMQSRADSKAKKIKEEGKIKVAEAKAKAKAQGKVDKAKEKVEAKLKKINSKSSAAKEKSLSELSNAEIKAKIERIKLENELKSLTPEQKSAGQKFIEKIGKDVIGPAAISAGKDAMTNFLKNKMSDALGLNKKDVDDGLGALKKEVDRLELQKRKTVAEDYFNSRNKKKTESSTNKSDDKSTTNKSSDKKVDDKYDDFGSNIQNKTRSKTSSNSVDTPARSPSLDNTKLLGQTYIAGLLGDGKKDDD